MVHSQKPLKGHMMGKQTRHLWTGCGPSPAPALCPPSAAHKVGTTSLELAWTVFMS